MADFTLNRDQHTGKLSWIPPQRQYPREKRSITFSNNTKLKIRLSFRGQKGHLNADPHPVKLDAEALDVPVTIDPDAEDVFVGNMQTETCPTCGQALRHPMHARSVADVTYVGGYPTMLDGPERADSDPVIIIQD